MSLSWKVARNIAEGFLLGTAGVKVLSSKGAKKKYVKATAAGLRARDYIIETATTIRENADDILEEAKELNARIDAEDELTVLGE